MFTSARRRLCFAVAGIRGQNRGVDETTLAALAQAADELNLPAHYISCVRPLLRDVEGPWPRCCGSGCEPCADTLTNVANRTLQLLGKKREAPLP